MRGEQPWTAQLLVGDESKGLRIEKLAKAARGRGLRAAWGVGSAGCRWRWRARRVRLARRALASRCGLATRCAGLAARVWLDAEGFGPAVSAGAVEVAAKVKAASMPAPAAIVRKLMSVHPLRSPTSAIVARRMAPSGRNWGNLSINAPHYSTAVREARAVTRLFQFDVARDFQRDADLADRERHFCGQRLVAFQPAAGNGVAHGLLDLALRRDPDFFQKSPHARVEGILVHGVSS